MKSEEQMPGRPQKCELCGHILNPHVEIYKTHTLLCSTCFQQMDTLPEVLANSLERFLIGNVV